MLEYKAWTAIATSAAVTSMPNFKASRVLPGYRLRYNGSLAIFRRIYRRVTVSHFSFKGGSDRKGFLFLFLLTVAGPVASGPFPIFFPPLRLQPKYKIVRKVFLVDDLSETYQGFEL